MIIIHNKQLNTVYDQFSIFVWLRSLSKLDAWKAVRQFLLHVYLNIC